MSFSPLTLSPHLWLKADAGAYTDAGSTLATDGQTVRQWNDQSGNSRHASQATSGARPVYKATAGPGGLPCLRFDGVDDYLASTIALSGTVAECWMVLRRISLIGSASPALAFFSGQLNDYDNVQGFIVAYEGAGDRLDTYRNGVVSGVAHPGNAVAFAFHTRFDAANDTVAYNGTDQTPAASTGTFSSDGLWVCARRVASAPTAFANYDVGELILFAATLTTAGRKNVHKYLNRKWGLYPGDTAFRPPLSPALIRPALA